jgi:hypothetical protein
MISFNYYDKVQLSAPLPFQWEVVGTKLASCVIRSLVVSWLDRILHCHPRKRPVFVRAGGRGGGITGKSAPGVFTPPYSQGDDIPSMAGIHVFARVCILPPLSLPLTGRSHSRLFIPDTLSLSPARLL